MVSKPYVCENDETAKDTKAGDDEVEECVSVLGELKSVLGYQKLELGSAFYFYDTLVSLKLQELGSAFIRGSHVTLCTV